MAKPTKDGFCAAQLTSPDGMLVYPCNCTRWRHEDKERCERIGMPLLTDHAFTAKRFTRRTPIPKPYEPMPIPGQECPGYRKINIRQAAECIKCNGGFVGFFVGNKVNSFHFFGGWYLASPVSYSNLADFNIGYNEMSYYMDPEPGSRVAIYWKLPTKTKATP